MKAFLDTNRYGPTDQKHGALWAANRRVCARHAYVRGIALSLSSRPAGRAELRESLRLYPLSVKAWVAWLLTFVLTAISLRVAQAIRRLRGAIWMLLHR